MAMIGASTRLPQDFAVWRRLLHILAAVLCQDVVSTLAAQFPYLVRILALPSQSA